MNQASLTCPMCKRVNEPGTRFCRSCGRLLVEPHQEDSEAEHAPLYESQGALPVVEVMPVEPARPTVPMDMTHARLIIRLLPPESPEGDGGASASSPRVGEYTLDGRTITVGRTQGCDIIFDGDTLTSRRHAILRFDGARYVLADLGSSNGTFINDVEITTPTALKHGDRILIGEHELLFLLDQARPIAAAATQVNAPASPPATAVALEAPPEAAAALAAVAAAEPDVEPLALLAQPASETAQAAQTSETAQMSEVTQASEANDGVERGGATTGLPRDGATAKYASVSRLSSELAASASRMVAPPRDGQDDAEMAAIRQRLLEASDALARQAALQAALAERRRAVLVETREHVADLLADLRGDDTVANSPVQHKREIGLIELVDVVAANPNNRERVYELVQRADELAHALRALAPSEGRWSYERNHTVRNLEDMLYRLRDLP